MVGMVDSEHYVFVGREPEKIGEATEVNEVERMEWVPLPSVRALIKSGDVWNSGTLVALMGLLTLDGSQAAFPMRTVRSRMRRRWRAEPVSWASSPARARWRRLRLFAADVESGGHVAP